MSIYSVEVIHGHEDGPDYYRVGGKLWDRKIADIIEVNNNFLFYDEEDNLIMEIRNCPVVVTYESGEVNG